MRARLLLQGLWRQGIAWDECLLPDIEDLWTEWVSELPVLSALRIPRCLLLASQGHDSEAIHLIADASPHAYGVAAFVRQPVVDGSFTVRLLMSKTRIPPLKTVSLPRLELLACLLVARLWHYIRKMPEFSPCVAYFWTYSTVPLH